ncbi:hypothetical protein PQ689_03340 [Thermoanaerobacterium thermosaccharolyticum]|uniref:hypothetical protein n=1 Tax=Thermoanaerobacterium thermosaccharolyticum TaxID=1517 RepID=UPI003DA7DDC2
MITQYDIKIGDKVYSLKYNNKALRMLEKVFEMPISKIGEKMQGDIGINDLTEVFRIGLLHQVPNLDIEQTDEIIDEMGLQKASEAIAKAFELAFGAQEVKPNSKN